MKNYLDLLRDIKENGVQKEDRTGTGTLAVFSRELRFNLQEGFPLMTTKEIHIPSVGHELLWFLMGETNIEYLKENGVKIWDAWADEDGNLGPVYGVQWRNFGGVDQIKQVIDQIKSNPDSRRHFVSAWNPVDVPNMALPPCHFAFQFIVIDGKLYCKFFMRSTDAFLGLPFNIASYALLTHMVAQQCDLEVGELVYSGTDVHLYSNHLEQVDLQLTREPRPLPQLVIKRKPDSIFDYKFEDFEFVGYDPHPKIKAPVAI